MSNIIISDTNKVLPIIELYTAVQGEGSRVGMPTIVIRTTGCTHRCFVDVPGRHVAKVFSATGRKIPLKQVSVGQKLQAWDTKNSKLVETEVIGLDRSEVTEYCQIKTEKGSFVVTPEHPFLTTRGWMFAKDLTDQDELVHIGGNMRNSFRMITHNPMKVAEVAEKVRNHENYRDFSDPEHKKLSDNTRISRYGSLDPKAVFSQEATESFRKRASERIQKDNPMKNLDVISNSISKRRNLGWGFKGGMSKVEKRFWEYLQNSDLKDLFWFTGDGGFSIKSKGKVKVPDFKMHGQNYFIELGIETGPKGFRPSWNNYIKELSETYSESSLPGVKVLAINMAEDRDTILEKVRRFVTNGIKVLAVKTINTGKKYSTYNLHCAPFDNYLVNTSKSTQAVVSHNCYFGEGGWCDSWYSSIHPEKGSFTLQHIYDLYDNNPHINEMMLTGGSPTMHPALVNTLATYCHEKGIIMTIETEGSHEIHTDHPIGLISLSPKFTNSIPKIGILTPKGDVVDERMVKLHNKFRMNYDAMKYNLQNHSDFHLKIVINPIQQPEIWEEVLECIDILHVPNHKVYLMPPGDTREALLQSYGDVMNFCRDNGYNFTGRPHIIAFDTERRV